MLKTVNKNNYKFVKKENIILGYDYYENNFYCLILRLKMSEIYDGDISNNNKSEDTSSDTTTDTDTSSCKSYLVASIRKKVRREIHDELNNYDNIEYDEIEEYDGEYDETQESSINQIEIEDDGEELFVDNLECIEPHHCPDIDVVEDRSDYEIINESKCIPIKNRYRKQTWYEYFRKLYMVTVILIISIVVYFYYSYSRRKENIVSKL